MLRVSSSIAALRKVDNLVYTLTHATQAAHPTHGSRVRVVSAWMLHVRKWFPTSPKSTHVDTGCPLMMHAFVGIKYHLII